MLKQRILTISILLPLFVWLLWFSSNTMFLWVTAGVISLAAFEWLKLLKLNKVVFGFLWLIFLAIIGFYTFNENVFLNVAQVDELKHFMVKSLLVVGFCWLVYFLAVLGRGEILSFRKKNAALMVNTIPFTKAPFLNLMFIFNYYLPCLLALIPCWLAINYLKIYSKYLLVFACSIIVAADIGAYIFGKLFGKHKLTIVSPGKTWEGVLGGYIAALLVASIYIILNINSVAFNYNEYYYYYFNNEFNFPNPIECVLASSNYIFILKIFLITTVTFIFSVIGDLCESLLKRIAGVKDSGNILPGHGGILDRIDSFCSGIPIFLLSFLLLNKYLE